MRHTAPSTSCRISDILRWKCSGAEVMPNGSRLKQNLPNGVMKVVSMADSLASGICQNPELASIFENTLALANCARACSTAGSGCRSRRTHLFNHVRSTQIRTLPSALGTTTMPAHHSVGSRTRLTTRISSMRSSSALTLGSNGIAIRRGVDSA